MEEKSIVLKVGGSLLYNNELHLNKPFLSQLHKWVEELRLRYPRIVLFVGGGKLSRYLSSELADYSLGDADVDKIGIEVTRTNAAMIASILGSEREGVSVPDSFGELLDTAVTSREYILVSGGHKSGWSSDMNAAMLADILNAKRFTKISNISGVFNRDPAKHPGAIKIDDMSWTEYFELFDIHPDSKHVPNRHMPIGVTAAKFASKKAIEVVMCGGTELDVLDVSFDSLQKSGSLLHP